MERRISNIEQMIRSVALWLGLGLFALVPVSAFQSVQVATIGASVVIGGGGPGLGKYKIQHVPIPNVSLVTQQIIILGQAGSEVPPSDPSYVSFLKVDSDFGPLPERRTRVQVQYRFVSAIDPDPKLRFSRTGYIEGPDPTAFAFEIPGSSVTLGVLQYRIIAQTIHYENDQLVATAQNTYPAPTVDDPAPYITVSVQANASEVIGSDGGNVILEDGNPADGESQINAPRAPRDLTTLSIDEVPLNSPFIPQSQGGAQPNVRAMVSLLNPIRVYHLEASPPYAGYMSLSLQYPDFQYPLGQDGVVDGTNLPEANVKVFAWDGATWRQLGGVVNAQQNLVTVRSPFYSFVAIAAGGPTAPNDRRPMEKIITPNGDTVNDNLNFIFDMGQNVKVEIFDVTGHRVRTFFSEITSQWDGRDDNGQIVESGVYIYQYNVDGTRVSGVAAVAK